MAFLLLAYDGQDSYERRMSCRQAHIELIDELRDSKKALMGAALVDEQGKMIGSSLYLDMNQTELDDYLKQEPYLTNKVWDKIDIRPCNIGPSFINHK